MDPGIFDLWKAFKSSVLLKHGGNKYPGWCSRGAVGLTCVVCVGLGTSQLGLCLPHFALVAPFCPRSRLNAKNTSQNVSLQIVAALTNLSALLGGFFFVLICFGFV